MTTEGPGPDQAATLGYADFGLWYDRYRLDVLQPALEQANAALDRELDEVLSDRDLARIRTTSGRVKSKRRTWRKLRQPRYQGRIGELADIPEVIDDLVGLRITCTNLRDIEMVQTALDHLPRFADSGGLWLDPTTERDYVVEPKESGYRGWHVNLGVLVDVDGRPTPVTCELQVRTLLQDSWGELTHEDTYSKDGALPPLVEVLSKRMADLFATLDDIAEDLRTELDRIDEAVVDDSGDEAEGATPSIVDSEPATGQAADAEAFLRDRWGAIDRPTDLAVLAWALQREFGAEVSDDWFGHRTFKRFVGRALPDAEISSGRHAFLLPPGSSDATEDASAEGEPSGRPPSGDDDTGGEADGRSVTEIPDAAHALRRVDRGFPLLQQDEWSLLFGELADAWRRIGPQTQSASSVNRLTRSARDRAEARGQSVSRRHLAYVARAMLSGEMTGDGSRYGPLDSAEIAELFTNQTLARMAELRIVGARNRRGRAMVRSWLNGGG